MVGACTGGTLIAKVSLRGVISVVEEVESAVANGHRVLGVSGRFPPACVPVCSVSWGVLMIPDMYDL